jgi:hypothetical protein
MVMTAINDRNLGLGLSHDEGWDYGIWYYLLLASGVVTDGQDPLGLLLHCTDYLQYIQRTEIITSVAVFVFIPLSSLTSQMLPIHSY